MRKLVIFSMLLVLTAGIASAQLANGIYVCAWGRGAFVPLWVETKEFQYGTERVSTDSFTNEEIFYNGTGVTWDPINKPRVDFRIMGFAQHVGFVIHVNSEFLESTGNGDNGAQLWVKPFGNDMLKLTVANQMIEDTLRGRISADTGFENFVMGASMMGYKGKLGEAGRSPQEPLNQDVIFNRFAGGRGTSNTANLANTSTHLGSPLSNVFFLSSSPIDGLFLGLMLQGMFPETELEETWRQMQFGAGYSIKLYDKEVGFIRAQYIGGYFGEEKTSEDSFKLEEPSKFEAAFTFSAIQDLTVELGVKYWTPVIDYIWTPVKDKGKESFRGIDVALGASYKYDKFNITAMAQALYLGAYTNSRVHNLNNDKNEGYDGAHLVFNLIPSYGFDFGTVGLSLIYQSKLANTENDGKIDETSAYSLFGAGIFYQIGFAGGSLKAGIAYAAPPIMTGYPSVALPGGGFGPSSDLKTGFYGRGKITIPIILEYAFF